MFSPTVNNDVMFNWIWYSKPSVCCHEMGSVFASFLTSSANAVLSVLVSTYPQAVMLFIIQHPGETWNGELETRSLVVSGFTLVLAVCLFTSQALSHASYKADMTFFFLHRTGLFVQKKQLCDVNNREDKQMSHIRQKNTRLIRF